MFLYWRNGEQRFPRGLLGLAFDGCLVALLPEAEADIYLPAGQKTEHFRPCRLPSSSASSGQRRAEAAAWPGIGGERHRDVPRRRVRQDVCRAEEPISGHAAALTEASKPQAGTLPGRIREIRTLTPTPLPTGEGLEAARLDLPQDQLTHGDDAAEAAAWPGIGGERHRDVPRRRVRQDVCRAEEPISGHAAALTEASKPQAGTLPGRIREIRTLTPTPLPTGEGLEAARLDLPQDQLTHGDDAAEAAAWPGIGGERHRDVPRRRVRQDVCRAEEPISGHAAALTEASKPQAGTLPGRIREIRTLTPTPLPTGEGLEAPLLPFGVQRLPTVSRLWWLKTPTQPPAASPSVHHARAAPMPPRRCSCHPGWRRWSAGTADSPPSKMPGRQRWRAPSGSTAGRR